MPGISVQGAVQVRDREVPRVKSGPGVPGVGEQRGPFLSCAVCPVLWLAAVVSRWSLAGGESEPGAHLMQQPLRHHRFTWPQLQLQASRPAGTGRVDRSLTWHSFTGW